MVSQRSASEGRFTFSAADSGEHRLCFNPSGNGPLHGWLAGGMSVGGVKLTLDLAIGETSNIESADKGKINDIVQKIIDLNSRMKHIKNEQMFQRVNTMFRFAGRLKANNVS